MFDFHLEFFFCYILQATTQFQSVCDEVLCFL
jgi:hypothetical protein